jgi:hypothetical protein
MFKRFYLFKNGMMVSKSDDQELPIGFHFCTSDTNPFNFIENKVIEMSTSAIFKLLKERKKEIKYVSIIESDLYFESDDNQFLIGSIIEPHKIDTEIQDIYFKAKNFLSTNINFSLLDDNVKEILCQKGIVTYFSDHSLGDYKLRMTNQLIPALKKDMQVKIGFHDVPKESSLFYTLMLVERGTILSHHIYKCLKY